MTLWRLLAHFAANNPTSTALQKALAALGRRAGVDRVWIAQYNDGLTHFWNTHEWTRRGVPSFLGALQGAPVSMIAWAHEKLLRHESMVIDDVDRMPRAGRALQAELRRQKVMSTITMPLFLEDKLIGFFGYDSVQRQINWTHSEQALLQRASRYLSALVAKERRGSQKGLLQTVTVPEQIIYVRHASAMLAVDTAHIIFVRAEGDYTHLQLTHGRSFTVLRSLRSWDTYLPQGAFIRVHKQYLVRADRILDFGKGEGRS
ncbi:MAG TPA: GAF domain-containing DNA-binding protein, partial [Verrucomicrobium sp.]|nr:GAF domain-containing DNA-binding protein [Verrucomicrobium sp.]